MPLSVCRILIIDDDADILQSARLLLQQYYKQVDTEQDPKTINRIVSQNDYDLVLLDMNFRRGEHDGREGLYWLERIRTIRPQLPVVLITAYGDVALAVEAMRQGATNFVLKPWKNQKLLDTVASALSSADPWPRDKATDHETPTMIGQSPGMRSVDELIDKVAATTANVLILGENGTGKELVAQALHQRSLRRQQPFVRVDLGAMTPSLLESELFGHVRGAFTDAHRDQPGKFEIAQGGTLFLDEIGNLPLAQQAKLLTALQSRRIRRVGSNEEIPLDIRLICATNQPLAQMVQNHSEPSFREDLFYRINTVEIRVPPLRARGGDIRRLAEHFLAAYAAQYRKPVPALSDAALRKLEQYDWPGNVRELQHAVERAVILSEAADLSPDAFDLPPPRTATASDAARTLDENERNFIRQALQQHDGNVTRTARALGITRTALYRRLDKYGL